MKLKKFIKIKTKKKSNQIIEQEIYDGDKYILLKYDNNDLIYKKEIIKNGINQYTKIIVSDGYDEDGNKIKKMKKCKCKKDEEIPRFDSDILSILLK